MIEEPKLLIVGRDGELEEDVTKLLGDEFKGYELSEDNIKAIELFVEFKPHLLLLINSKLEKSEEFYLEMFRNLDQSKIPMHKSIVTCKQADSSVAYDLCRRHIFDDYVIVKPLFDPHRLRMSLVLAFDRLMQGSASDRISQNFAGTNQVLNDLMNVLNETAKRSDDIKSATDADYQNLMTQVFSDFDRLQSHLINDDLKDIVEIRDPEKLVKEFEQFKQSQLKSQFEKSQQKIDTRLEGFSNDISSECKAREERVTDLTRKINAVSAKILLVDDDEMYLSVLEKILETAGYQVISALEGAQGLHTLARTNPDIVCVDFEMPGINGLDLIREIRSHVTAENGMRIIMITGSNDRSLVQQAIDAGVNDFIIKPAKAKTVLDKVANQLGKKLSSQSATIKD